MSNDLISRQAAIDFFKNVPYIKEHPNLGALINEWIKQIPAVQPEQKAGRWLISKERFLPEYVCSNCKTYYPMIAYEGTPTYSPLSCKNMNFCPNCGAKMEVSKTDFDDEACIWHIPKNEQDATANRHGDHKWIPFTTRELTNEEKQAHPDGIFILDCPLPDDGQEILISRNGWVFLDTYYYDGECYLDSGYTIEDGMAWMPLPEPYL